MARTYNESKAVFLAGPIEWWWDTPEEPDRFNSPAAKRYRRHREAVADFFVSRHFLVYMPHQAFKGDWNEKMQPVNDYVLGLSDIVVNMKPNDIPGLVCNGTDHEWELARKLGKVLIELPPMEIDRDRASYLVERDLHYGDTFNKSLIEMYIETERLKNGW